jgi:hypothetical protein
MHLPAGAQSYIVQTGCDTVSMNPPLVRVQFSITNIGGLGVCSVVMDPRVPGQVPDDSCYVSSCGSPAGWSCYPSGGDGPASWYPLLQMDCLASGVSLDQFEMVYTPHACCYFVDIYYSSIDPITEQFCPDCSVAVPAKRGTWGWVKAIYR